MNTPSKAAGFEASREVSKEAQAHRAERKGISQA